MVGRVAPFGDGASVLWGAVGLDCYAGLWCVSGLRLGNPRPSQECPNIFIRA